MEETSSLPTPQHAEEAGELFVDVNIFYSLYRFAHKEKNNLLSVSNILSHFMT